VNAALALVSVAALALVAAAGVAAGYRRRDPVPIEPPVDPLEDRRLALLRSLADLDEARASGGLDDENYLRLRADTEGRIARLLRAIDERSTRTVIEADAGPGGRAARPGSVPPWAVAILLAATVGSVLVVGLLREAEPLAAPAAAPGDDPLAFFEERVREHPGDLAARLDLAHRYLDASRVGEALTQYRVALEVDPRNAEALANVGLILHLAGRPADGLRSVDAALESAPEYPEALFIRGVILLCGLDRPTPAAGAFESYLDAAPFGAERGTVQELLGAIDAGTPAAQLCGA
jgi:cytochrome c-type biogenesis protein CcmH/NrfG